MSAERDARGILSLRSASVWYGRGWEFADLVDCLDGAALTFGQYGAADSATTDMASARPPARDLAVVFHLADVSKDLDSDRCHLPRTEAEHDDAGEARTDRRATSGWLPLTASVVARTRLRGSPVGVGLLPPAAARCVALPRADAAARLDDLDAAGRDLFRLRLRLPHPPALAGAPVPLRGRR